MGNCNSNDSTRVATAKLILFDGELQEFSYPVKVSYLLQKYPMCFICNSDEMDFDDVVTAISEDEVLQPGQLYFALPLNRLSHRLQAKEMAAMAVKASSALMKSGRGKKCGCRRKQILLFDEDIANRRVDSGLGGAGAGNMSGRGRSSSGASRENFRKKLNAIPE